MDLLFSDFLELMRQPSTFLELACIAALVGVAALVGRRVRQHASAGSGLPTSGARRLAFPVTAIVLLALMRFVAHHFGWNLHFVAVAVQLLVALAAVRMAVFALRRAFPDSTAVPGFERWLVTLIWAGVALDILGVLPELIAWLDGFALHIGRTRITLWEVLQGAASVLATLIVALWLGGIVEGRLMGAPALDSSVKVVLTRVVKTILILVAVLLGMSLVGLDLTTLSVFGGALGVGLGIGMQKIASNYVSGFIILLDHSIRIGNIIQVGQDRGEVKQITTRYTVLRTGGGLHVLVPNETLVSSTVQNETYADPRQRIPLLVQVAYGSDVERALAILEELARKEPRVIADPAPRAFLASLDDSGLSLELGFWIADPNNGNLDIRSSINLGILRRFAAEGIQIPFPQREIRMVLPDGQGSTAAAGVN